jgi:hypothetical protein
MCCSDQLNPQPSTVIHRIGALCFGYAQHERLERALSFLTVI